MTRKKLKFRGGTLLLEFRTIQEPILNKSATTDSMLKRRWPYFASSVFMAAANFYGDWVLGLSNVIG